MSTRSNRNFLYNISIFVFHDWIHYRYSDWYFKMTDTTFLTFSELEASNHIKICLDYFFAHDGKNRYKFSGAYLKYSKLGDDTLITTRRYFNIVRSTNLVSEQLVFRQQTVKGFQYLINKRFFTLANRYNRRISRQNSRVSTPVSTSNTAVDETKDNSPTNSASIPLFTKISTFSCRNMIYRLLRLKNMISS